MPAAWQIKWMNWRSNWNIRILLGSQRLGWMADMIGLFSIKGYTGFRKDRRGGGNLTVNKGYIKGM